MNNIRNLTVAQLAIAQTGKEIRLTTGETLCAVFEHEYWKYMISYQGQTGMVRVAPNAGLQAAIWAINASQEEYNEEMFSF